MTLLRRYRAFGEALLSAALFGIATPFSKTLLAGLSPNVLAGLLYLGAALFLLPYVVARRRSRKVIFPHDWRNRLYLLGAVFFGGILGPVLLLVGLKIALAASVSMWLNLETVATAVFAAVLFKEHIGKTTWLGNVGVVACGILLMLDQGWAGLLGIACVGGAGIAWGLDNNFTASIDSITPQMSTFWKGLVAGTTNLAIGLLLFGVPHGGQWAWALVLGGISYGASITLYIMSAQHIGAARSQMVFASAPFWGVLFSVMWLGEHMSGLQVFAGCVLAGSIVLLLLDRHYHEHDHILMEHDHSHRHDEDHHLHTHDGLPESYSHSHFHTHQPTAHSHPHWPDLHHRHGH